MSGDKKDMEMRTLGGTRVVSSRVPKAVECKRAILTFSTTLLAVKCLANGHTNSSVLGMMSKEATIFKVLASAHTHTHSGPVVQGFNIFWRGKKLQI